MTGCALITQGRYQSVPVNSNPIGAAVTTECGNGVQNSGVTPVTVNLRRGADTCRVTLSKEGYDDSVMAFAKSVAPIVWGNILIGGVIGVIVDASTGAMYRRTPDSVQVNLTKKP